jgi:voltage-dependent potassium channel beta subunit
MSKSSMPYRKLGKSGLSVSVVGLGGWTTFGGSVNDSDLIKEIHRRAFEAGINFYDIADVYANGESEKVMGQALKEFPRNELVISSKVFWPMSEDVNDRGLSRKHIMESIDRSLKRIGTDYLDLYFCHRYDDQTPIEETVRAMDDLIHQGKVLYWGTSEWTGDQLREAHEVCRSGGFYPPTVEQPQYSLMAREKFEKDIQSTVSKLGMGIVTWSPLASGFLTGKYDNGIEAGRLAKMDWLKELLYTPENIEKVKQMKKLADELGATRAELAIAWVMTQSGVSSVILGATTIEQLNENLKSLSVNLSDDTDRKLKALFS